MYYELHITMVGDKDLIQKAVEEIGWKFSCIDGDPVLGDGVKCYATKLLAGKHTLDYVETDLKGAYTWLLLQGFNAIRYKIELVLIDSKQSLTKILNK